MEENKSIAIFENKKIRRLWNNEEWWFVVEDVVVALTDSTDPKQYISKLRQRDEYYHKGGYKLYTPFPCQQLVVLKI